MVVPWEDATFAGSAGRPLDIGAIFGAIWRRWLIFTLVFLAVLAAASAVIFSLRPIYRSEAMLVIDSRRPQFSDVSPVVETQPQASDLNFVRSEQQVFTSDELARRVVERLNLDKDPDFAPNPSTLSKILAYLGLDHAFGDAGGAPDTDSLNTAVQIYRERLTAFNDGKSFVIQVGFSHSDPLRAREILAAHLALYLGDQRAHKKFVIAKAGRWIDQELARLREKVEQSEQNLQAFRIQNRLVRNGGETTSGRQLSDLTAQLARARSDLSRQNSRNAEVSSGRPDSIVLRSELIQRLRQQEAQLSSEVAQLQQRYGPDHPRLAGLRLALADVRNRTRAETARLTASSGSDVAISRADVQQLEQQVANFERQAVATSQAELTAIQLNRETEADRRLYSDLLARSKQVEIQREIQEPDARVVSSPSLAVNPAFPRRGLLLVIAAASAAVISGSLVLLLERFRRHTHTLAEIETFHGLAGLGSLPRVRRLRARTAARSDMPLRQPKLATAVQAIGNSIEFQMRERGPKVIVLASPGRGEGRTSLSVLLARSLAEKGDRVLLVDADLRRRGVTVRLGLEGAPGLTEVAQEAASLHDLVVTGPEGLQPAAVSRGDKEFAFDVLPAGRSRTDPHTILHRTALRTFLSEVRSRYDSIIIDTPPLGEVDDALVFAGEADATVIVVRRAQTSDKALQAALRRLQLADAQVVGAVLNGTTTSSQETVRNPISTGTGMSHNWARAYLATRG